MSHEKYDVTGGYCVKKCEEHDDAHFLTPWRNRLFRLAPLTSISSIGLYWIYFGYRVKFTMDAQNFAHTTYIMAWVFILMETRTAVPTLLNQIWLCGLIKGRHRPQLRLLGNNVPTVDVFVTCAGEDSNVILDTIKAAAAIDWPRDKFRVVVLDDKDSSDVHWEVQALRCQFSNIYYTARQKNKHVHHDFKAGNLNHGLSFVQGLEGGGAEYVAALDADMLVKPEWLRAIMPHLISDPQTGLACPPQLFYNVLKGDPLAQNMGYFFHTFEPIKDRMGVAWCTGSGYAIRRAALHQIGGFPNGSMAEDVLCSSLLLAAGWKTCYVHEPLQHGLVPDSFAGHVRQRTRWTIGTIQNTAKLGWCPFGEAACKLGFFQRICGPLFTLGAFLAVVDAAALLTFPIMLLSSSRLIAYQGDDQLRWLIRLAFLMLLGTRINEWILSLPPGYLVAQREIHAGFWMSSYHAVAIIRSFLLPQWLGGKVTGFVPSGSIKSDLPERNQRSCAPLMRRFFVIGWNGGVLGLVLYIFFVMAAVASSVGHVFTTSMPKSSSQEAGWMFILSHAGWPPLVWMWTTCLAAYAVPILYMFQPPSVPDREELLVRCKDTGVAYPKDDVDADAGRLWSTTAYIQELLYSLVTLYTTIAFLGSLVT